jgi:hypothetical protein
MTRPRLLTASFALVLLVAACTSNNAATAAPAQGAAATPAPAAAAANAASPPAVAVTASTTAGNTTGGVPASGKDPCVLLTAADAKALLAMDYEPTANKTDSPFLSCAYSNNSGSEAVILAISTNSLSIAKFGVDGATDLAGLGDAAFVAGGGRNAVVAWTSGGIAYKLSWNTLSTATRMAATDPVIALAHTIAARI